MTHTTLKHYLEAEVTKNGLPQKLADLITGVAETSKEISYEVSRGALAGVLGMAGTENIQGEDQKKLDVISNRLMVEGCIATGAVSAMASEEMDHALLVPADKPVGPYLICFDPLDGSSNIDINVSIGTIFSVGLLASSLSSTSVGTYAGAEIMHGLLRVKAPMWACRVVTLVPALIVLWFAKNPTEALIIGQVILSIGIPFAIIPLMKYTHDRSLMGDYVDGPVKFAINMVVVSLIVALNVILVFLTLSGRS